MSSPDGGIDAIPHPFNGRRCVCGSPVWLTPTGWRDRSGSGSHPVPSQVRCWT